MCEHNRRFVKFNTHTREVYYVIIYCKLLRFLTMRPFYDCIGYCKRKAVLLVKDISPDIELKRHLYCPRKKKTKFSPLKLDN